MNGLKCLEMRYITVPQACQGTVRIPSRLFQT